MTPYSLALALTQITVPRDARHLFDLGRHLVLFHLEARQVVFDPFVRPRAAVLVLPRQLYDLAQECSGPCC